MPLKFTDLTGSFEAAWDGFSCVVLREKGGLGPNFHLPRHVVERMLGLFPARSPAETKPDDETAP